MSATDNPARMMHVDLITQQRRLRHLRSLSARNITAERSKGQKDKLMETYFTMHLTEKSQAFYTSEKIQDSLNPTWRSFDLNSKNTSEVDTASANLVVRVWGGDSKNFKLIIEWSVSLSGLKYLGDKIYKDGKGYPPNSLIFGMFEGFYGAPDTSKEYKNDDSALYQSTLSVEASAVRQSYTSSSLYRIHTNQRAIKQTEATVSKVKSAIEKQLLLSRDKAKLLAERERLRLKAALLKEEIRRQCTSLQRERETQQRDSQKIDAKAREVILRRERLRSDKEKLHEDRKKHIENREMFLKVGAQLTMRRRTLISELSFIYPIVELPDHSNIICGVKLPNAESYSGTDDTTIATALGYTCLLMIKMSQFLELPLRYPMYHRGSRSIIRDHITSKLQERDRDFPLYSKGKEKFQFNYAVYLLNKNVAQLRFYCGLPTTDLRGTLPNLKTLLELRWGVRFDHQNQPTVYPENATVATATLTPNNAQLPQLANLQPSHPPRNMVESPRESPRASPQASPKSSPKSSPRGSPRRGRRSNAGSTTESPPPEYSSVPGYPGVMPGPEEHQGTVLSPPATRKDRVRELEGVVDMNYQGELESDEVGREAITMEEDLENEETDGKILDVFSSEDELESRGSTENLLGATGSSAPENASTSAVNSTEPLKRTRKYSPRKIFSQAESDSGDDILDGEEPDSPKDRQKYFDPLGARKCNQGAKALDKIDDDAEELLQNVNALDGLDEISSRTDALSDTRTSSFRYQSPSHQPSGN